MRRVGKSRLVKRTAWMAVLHPWLDWGEINANDLVLLANLSKDHNLRAYFCGTILIGFLFVSGVYTSDDAHHLPKSIAHIPKNC